jgi:hypothetical protein
MLEDMRGENAVQRIRWNRCMDHRLSFGVQSFHDRGRVRAAQGFQPAHTRLACIPSLRAKVLFSVYELFLTDLETGSQL